jgi:hypothetical protein
MKKTVYTLNVDGYAPEITDLTYPWLRQYASKIGASFHVIDSRCWPDFAPVYEKLQIGRLARERGDDWSIYIDSDALVHPDMFDVTDHLTPDTVAHNGADMAGNRWRYDDYFRRDGRHIGSCNWFTVASRLCLDLWAELDIPYDEAVSNIFPIRAELAAGLSPDHLIDDYILSRNIARYGLKFATVTSILAARGDPGNYLWHQYTITVPEKVAGLKAVMTAWGLDA